MGKWNLNLLSNFLCDGAICILSFAPLSGFLIPLFKWRMWSLQSFPFELEVPTLKSNRWPLLHGVPVNKDITRCVLGSGVMVGSKLTWSGSLVAFPKCLVSPALASWWIQVVYECWWVEALYVELNFILAISNLNFPQHLACILINKLPQSCY